MSRELFYEIEASPTQGVLPLSAIPLPTGVPAPDCIVIQAGVLYGDNASDAATGFLEDRDMRYVGIDEFRERLEDLEFDKKDRKSREAEVLRDIVRIYDLLNAAGWIMDVRLRYSY